MTPAQQSTRNWTPMPGRPGQEATQEEAAQDEPALDEPTQEEIQQWLSEAGHAVTSIDEAINSEDPSRARITLAGLMEQETPDRMYFAVHHPGESILYGNHFFLPQEDGSVAIWPEERNDKSNSSNLLPGVLDCDDQCAHIEYYRLHIGFRCPQCGQSYEHQRPGPRILTQQNEDLVLAYAAAREAGRAATEEAPTNLELALFVAEQIISRWDHRLGIGFIALMLEQDGEEKAQGYRSRARALLNSATGRNSTEAGPKVSQPSR